MSSEAKFIAQEYLALWKAHGVDGLPTNWDGIDLGAAPAPEWEAPPETAYPLMFVGDNREGLTDGPTGQLLAKILEAMGQNREKVALAGCGASLADEIAAARPRIIVALGELATQTLLGSHVSLSSHRGCFEPLSGDASISVLPTYHPAHLLRAPEAKKLVWEDMKKVMHQLSEA